MPSDPTECRENTACCVELAVAAKTEHLKVMLVELSRSWEKLAIDLENVLDTIEFRDLTRRGRERARFRLVQSPASFAAARFAHLELGVITSLAFTVCLGKNFDCVTVAGF
jgi:hypothetical protein